jgi:hypothetical protein
MLLQKVKRFLLAASIAFAAPCVMAQITADNTIYTSPAILTQSMMEDHAALVQQLFDVKCTPQQKAKHFQLIKNYWVNNDYKGMQDINNNLNFYRQLKKIPKAELDATVLQLRSALIMNIIEDAAAAEDSEWYLQNYYAAHPPLVRADFPLLKETADAVIDCEFFINKELKGLKVITVTNEQRKVAYKELAKQWVTFDSEKKKTIMNGASRMALIFFRWNKMGTMEKINIKLHYVGEKYLSPAEKTAYKNEMAQSNTGTGGQQWGFL